MSGRGQVPWVIHGWTVFAHPLFLTQLEALEQQVEALRQKDPVGYVKNNASKRLAAITRLAFDVIPQDPTRPEYRQGGALGDAFNAFNQCFTCVDINTCVLVAYRSFIVAHELGLCEVCEKYD